MVRSLGGVLLTALFALPTACGDADPVTSSGSGGAGTGAAGSAGASSGGSGGSGGGGRAGAANGTGGVTLPPVVCGGQTCRAPDPSGGLQGYACCTGGDTCGIRIPISPKCLPFQQPGHINPVCVPFQLPQATLPGCCSPDGCGALLTFDNVGCIPNPDFGRAAVACVFDETGSGDAGARD